MESEIDMKEKLATLITEHPDFPLRIVVDDIDPIAYHFELERFLIIDKVRLDKGLLIDDHYYIRSLDLNSYKSYCIGNTRLGDPIPTEEEMASLYEDLPWEDIIYVHVVRNEVIDNG